MKRFLKKSLIYSLTAAMLLPTWMVTSLLTVSHAYAASSVVSWNFPSNPDDAIADEGIAANLASTLTTVGADTPTFGTAGATTNSARATGWNNVGDKYWQVDFATSGYNALQLSSKQRSSTTGPRDFAVEYKVGAGAWTLVPGSTVAAADDYTSGVLAALDLPAALDDQPLVSLRWIMKTDLAVDQTTQGTVVGSTGASNIDDIAITGEAMAAPTMPTAGTVTTPTSNPAPTLSWNAVVANPPVDKYIVTLDGTPIDVAAPAADYTPSINLIDGVHTWSVAAHNAVGNSPDSATGTFTVDTTAPATTIVTSVLAMTSDTTPDMTINVESGASFEIRNGATVSVSGTGTGADQIVTLSVLPEGTYSGFTLVASDALGNSVTVAVPQFIVDTTAPISNFVINSGATYTTSSIVTLNTTASDTFLPIKMRISNNADLSADGLNFDSGNWIDFTPTITGWNLPAGEGTKTVYAEFQDGGRNTTTPTLSDSITVDLNNPVITLNGSNPATVEALSTYTDAGATAADSLQGDLTSSIVTANPVNANVIGAYTVTYNVSDAAGHAATQVTRTVNVVDTTKPVITLIGSPAVTVEAGSTYTDQGATAADSYDGNITASIVPVSTVNSAVPGIYQVAYAVSDASGNPADQVIRTVTVVDTTKPTITSANSAPDTTGETSTVTVSATDNVAPTAAEISFDGKATWLTMTGAASPFTYTVAVPATSTAVINYSVRVKDAADNISDPLDRTINPQDNDKPVIIVTPLSKTLEFGSAYVDGGVTAADDVDGVITNKITRTGAIDPYKLGAQTIKYNVTDMVGNAAIEVTRTVTVVPKANQTAFGSNITITSTKPEIIIPSDASGDAIITIPATVTNATINAEALVTGTDTKVVTMPGMITMVMGNVTVVIPAGTVITGPSTWDGVINALQVKESTDIKPTVDQDKEAKEVATWEIGLGDTALTFDKPVKLLFAGQAGKSAGYYRAGVYTSITAVCSSATSPVITGNGECKIDVDNNADGKMDDMVVWTKHFTQFVTYSQTMVSFATAPIVAATKVEQNGDKIIRVEWQGIGRGVEKYDIFVNGVLSATKTNAAGDDTATKYSSDTKITADGKYEVVVKAYRGTEVVSSPTQTIEYAAAAAAPVTAAAPQFTAKPKANAAAPVVEEPKTEAPAADAADDSGKIAGTDESKTENVNWTPWIILFVLIILAGAATGGYFFWFGGDEELAEAKAGSVRTTVTEKPVRIEKQPEKVEVAEKEKPQVTESRPEPVAKKRPVAGKKAKRW